MLELNKIHIGDCIELMKQIDSDSIDAIITDPPYNIGIDTWDNIKNYETWMLQVFKQCERILKDNGTLWFFHMKFPVLARLNVSIEKETNFRHKQLIIINKGIQSIAGRTGDSLRSYPRATEYLQFYTFDDPTGAQQLGEQYQRINPMAKYLKEEFERAKVTNKEITSLFPSNTGGLTGCVFNWISGLNFPTKEQYNKMRYYLNKENEYEYLRKEYEDLRKEYEDLRYVFNLESNCTDVWDIKFYGKEFYEDTKTGHISQKPLKLIQRIIKTSTEEGGVVLDCFMGSGTTALACKMTNRRWIGIEKDAEYCKIAEARIKEYQNQSKLEIESKK